MDFNDRWGFLSQNGGALFRSSVLEPVPRDLRSLDVNFGILPFPNLDENQDKYYTLPEEYSLVFSIPVTADADFASLIMEALAAKPTGREPFRCAALRVPPKASREYYLSISVTPQKQILPTSREISSIERLRSELNQL